MAHEKLPLAHHLLDTIDTLVLGKRTQARLMLAAWLASGHILINDVPGVAKTRLARAFAQLVELSFARVQGTPDLLPQDITGGPIYDMKTGDLTFRPGPAFHHILLVDEVNRTTPRTQAALLECMEERQISMDGTTYPIPDPFIVIATQNPVEMEGTFPLPEAELDRFLISLSLGYPNEEDERQLVLGLASHDPLIGIAPVMSGEDLKALQAATHDVQIHDAVLTYLVSLCRATRAHPLVDLGVSPRTTVRFAQIAKSYAFLDDRLFVTPDDIKTLAPYVLSHRLQPSSSAEVSRINASTLVEEVLSGIPVPVEDTP